MSKFWSRRNSNSAEAVWEFISTKLGEIEQLEPNWNILQETYLVRWILLKLLEKQNISFENYLV